MGGEEGKGGSLKLVNFFEILTENLLRIPFSVIGGILSFASPSLETPGCSRQSPPPAVAAAVAVVAGVAQPGAGPRAQPAAQQAPAAAGAQPAAVLPPGLAPP